MNENKQHLLIARASLLDAMAALTKAHAGLVAAAQQLEAASDERTIHLAAQIRLSAGIAKGQAAIADVFRAQIPVVVTLNKLRAAAIQKSEGENSA